MKKFEEFLKYFKKKAHDIYLGLDIDIFLVE